MEIGTLGILGIADSMQKQEDYKDDPALTLFQATATHLAVSKVMGPLGHTPDAVASVVRDLRGFTGPFIKEPILKASFYTLEKSFNEAHRRGRDRISPRDLMVVMLTEEEHPIELIVDHLKIKVDDTIQKLRTAP